jgi:hypothetical protein
MRNSLLVANESLLGVFISFFCNFLVSNAATYLLSSLPNCDCMDTGSQQASKQAKKAPVGAVLQPHSVISLFGGFTGIYSPEASDD